MEKPIKSALVEKYTVLQNIYKRLNEQDYAIHLKREELCGLEEKLGKTKGIFKIKQRKELQKEIADTKTEISNMERRLSNIVKIYDYKTVKEFLNEFSNAKAANESYQKAYSDWKKQTTPEQATKAQEEPRSIKARLEQSKQRIKEQEKERKSTKHRSKDRGAR